MLVYNAEVNSLYKRSADLTHGALYLIHYSEGWRDRSKGWEKEEEGQNKKIQEETALIVKNNWKYRRDSSELIDWLSPHKKEIFLWLIFLKSLIV